MNYSMNYWHNKFYSLTQFWTQAILYFPSRCCKRNHAVFEAENMKLSMENVIWLPSQILCCMHKTELFSTRSATSSFHTKYSRWQMHEFSWQNACQLVCKLSAQSYVDAKCNKQHVVVKIETEAKQAYEAIGLWSRVLLEWAASPWFTVLQVHNILFW